MAGTDGGQYAPFAEVLRADGYRVVPFATQISKCAEEGPRASNRQCAVEEDRGRLERA